jgi:DNA-binding HxlR family transcriptional regulator
MRWRELDREACSIARAIGVVGDRWTLVILRDCFLRVRRFDDFQHSLGITRHLLADRLRKLVKAGVLGKVAYDESGRRFEYRLTQRGLDLYPVLMALVHWGDAHLAGKRGRPLLHRHLPCGHDFDPLTVCSHCAQPLEPRQVAVHPGPGAARAQPRAPRAKAAR